MSADTDFVPYTGEVDVWVSGGSPEKDVWTKVQRKVRNVYEKQIHVAKDTYRLAEQSGDEQAMASARVDAAQARAAAEKAGVKLAEWAA
jgi:hypothetical protein